MCPSWSDNNQGIGWKFKSRCKQWSEIRIGKSRNTTLAWRKIIHITQKDYPPSNCNWFLQFFNLKYKVWWSGFLDCFKLEFYRLQQTEIFVETRKKSSSSNSMFQTRELKNRVQIDWRSVCNLYWITAKCRTWQVIQVKHGFKIRVLCLVSVANLYSKIT